MHRRLTSFGDRGLVRGGGWSLELGSMRPTSLATPATLPAMAAITVALRRFSGHVGCFSTAGVAEQPGKTIPPALATWVSAPPSLEPSSSGDLWVSANRSGCNDNMTSAFRVPGFRRCHGFRRRCCCCCCCCPRRGGKDGALQGCGHHARPLPAWPRNGPLRRRRNVFAQVALGIGRRRAPLAGRRGVAGLGRPGRHSVGLDRLRHRPAAR